MVNKPSIYSKSIATIALGSNLNIPLSDLRLVPQFLVESLNTDLIEIESISRFYQTPAFPAGSGPDFINAAFCVATNLGAVELLSSLHHVETAFGRERPYRWSPRSLDLDLIFYDDLILPDRQTWHHWAQLPLEQAQTQAPDQLILPHPRAHERSFVLGPVNDIQPHKLHPALNKTVRDLWEGLPSQDRASLTPL